MGPVDPKVDLDLNENSVISFLEETYIRFSHKIFCKFLVQSQEKQNWFEGFPLGPLY